MNYRFLVSKSFHSGVVTRTSTLNGVPVYSNLLSRYGKIDEKEYQIEIVKGLPEKVNLNSSNSLAKEFISSDALLNAITISVDGKEIIPLNRQFDFEVGKSFNDYASNKTLVADYGEGYSLWDALNTPTYRYKLNELAMSMFPSLNPLTGVADVCSDTFYSHLIPLVSLTGIIPPQLDEDNVAYFNPTGSITVAEFLDSLNAIKYGSNSNMARRKSLDSLSSETDFFNEGYNSCLGGISSPFYRLYTRKELMMPITRLELAYITVVCWYDFINKFEHINSGTYSLGINTNWETPSRYVGKFKDGYDFKVFKKILDSDFSIVSTDIHDYKGDSSMEEFKKLLKTGSKALPLPMFMSLFELDALDLFYFEGNNLDPLREVSRGELTYFLVKLAKEFKAKFVSSGDNSY